MVYIRKNVLWRDVRNAFQPEVISQKCKKAPEGLGIPLLSFIAALACVGEDFIELREQILIDFLILHNVLPFGYFEFCSQKV